MQDLINQLITKFANNPTLVGFMMLVIFVLGVAVCILFVLLRKDAEDRIQSLKKSSEKRLEYEEKRTKIVLNAVRDSKQASETLRETLMIFLANAQGRGSGQKSGS